MRVLVLGGLLILGGCGGGSTTGTNYSDPPPMAEIVASPSPRATETPAEDTVVANAMGDTGAQNDTDVTNIM